MASQHTIETAIQQRYSCRTYRETPLTMDEYHALEQMLSRPPTCPRGSKVRFDIIAATPENTAALKGLLTYGIIKHPAGFILGAVESSDFDLEDYGYVMESIILDLVRMGMGTCWLGGTFNKSVFAQKIGVGANEAIPAVVAVGHLAPKRMMEKLIRMGSRAHQRKPWPDLFFNQTFNTPLSPEDAGSYRDPLEMIRIAPSASNKQPWRIVKENGCLHFYLQRTKNYYKRYNRLIGMADLQRIDMGIAMCHFELSAKARGLKGEWVSEDPNQSTLPPLTSYVRSWRMAD